MSKIIYIVHRNELAEEDTSKIQSICNNLEPDNIEARRPYIYSKRNICYGIYNPIESKNYIDSNVILGGYFETSESKWYDLKSSPPDGNYVLFRTGQDELEIISDILATRSIWYYFNDEILIAATSQRAIIQYLGDFQFNEKTIPWILANGLLGPGMSWDCRISLLPPDSVLNLDISKWKITIKTNQINFKINEATDKENIAELERLLKENLLRQNLSYSKWKLTLSGGYDSRGLICILPKVDKEGELLKSVTWGLKELQTNKLGDAYLAAKIADKLEVDHTFFNTNVSREPLKHLLNRFFLNGEGRIDHIGGYLDGFDIWKKIFESGTLGVIRGDEVFGSYNFISEFHLKDFVGLSLLTEYSNLKTDPYLMSFECEVPSEYKRLPGESFEIWRDRLYQSYLIPNFLASLADLKLSYVEQVNPFISKSLISHIRSMPDHLRTNKLAFRKIVDKINPNVGYAKLSSTSKRVDIMKDQKFIDILKEELESDLAGSIFPKTFINRLIGSIEGKKKDASFPRTMLRKIKVLIPKRVKQRILRITNLPTMDMAVLSFRVYTIVKMVRILRNDAKILLDEK